MAIFNDKYIEKSPAKRVPGLNSKRAGTRVPVFKTGTRVVKLLPVAIPRANISTHVI